MRHRNAQESNMHTKTLEGIQMQIWRFCVWGARNPSDLAACKAASEAEMHGFLEGTFVQQRFLLRSSESFLVRISLGGSSCKMSAFEGAAAACDKLSLWPENMV